MLTDEQIKNRLKKHNWAEFVWKGGREYLLESWRKVVEDVENGYDDRYLIEEYWDDLDVREAIQLVELDSEVTELDKRFKAAITSPEIRIRHGEDNYFWNFGYPKKAHGDLLKGILEFIEDNR